MRTLTKSERSLVIGAFSSLIILLSIFITSNLSTQNQNYQSRAAIAPVQNTSVPFKGRFLGDPIPMPASQNVSISPTFPIISKNVTNSNWVKITPATSPPARASSAMAFFGPTGKLILFGGTVGGWANDQEFDDTWEFDGTKWSLLSIFDSATGVGTPGPLFGHAMVYDEANQQIILFGGMSIDSFGQSFLSNSTWYFKINDFWKRPMWEEANLTVKPPARQRHAMAYDSTNHVTVIFGGANQMGDFYDDTWEFNGSIWEKIITPTNPGARFNPTMTFDQSLGKIILQGGYSRTGGRKTDTWAYDSRLHTWQLITASGVISDATSKAFGYNQSTSKIVLFGGNDTLDRTWEFDNTWKEVFPPNHPPSLYDSTMTYFPPLKSLVLFGGAHFNSANHSWDLLGDTWKYSASPTIEPITSCQKCNCTCISNTTSCKPGIAKCTDTVFSCQLVNGVCQAVKDTLEQKY